jgi:hypothetical protein
MVCLHVQWNCVAQCRATQLEAILFVCRLLCDRILLLRVHKYPLMVCIHRKLKFCTATSRSTIGKKSYRWSAMSHDRIMLSRIHKYPSNFAQFGRNGFITSAPGRTLPDVCRRHRVSGWLRRIPGGRQKERSRIKVAYNGHWLRQGDQMSLWKSAQNVAKPIFWSNLMHKLNRWII